MRPKRKTTSRMLREEKQKIKCLTPKYGRTVENRLTSVGFSSITNVICHRYDDMGWSVNDEIQ
jgi:hypothetical protein